MGTVAVSFAILKGKVTIVPLLMCLTMVVSSRVQRVLVFQWTLECICGPDLVVRSPSML
jgi:hypothetical protein